MKNALLLALGLLTSVSVLAQSSIHLQGKVIDSNGSPVPSAEITLLDPVTNTFTTTSADRKGKYSLDFLPKGKDTFTLSAKKGNLASVSQIINPEHVPDELNLSIVTPQSLPSNRPSTYTSSENILQTGTPVRLVLQENLSSADTTMGQEVAFKVIDDVIVNGYLLIPHGALAKGTVTETQAKRRMGKAGKLNVNIDYADMEDGEHAALSAVKNTKGGGHGGAVTTGVVVTALVFWPAAPLFLLMHGKDITIPEGTQITSFINGDIRFNPAKFSKVEAGQ